MSTRKPDELLSRLISGEIDAADEAHLFRELSASPELQKKLGQEMVVDALLRTRLGREGPSQALYDQIMEKLSEKDRQSASRAGSTPKREKVVAWPRILLRIAAAVLLCVGVVYVVSNLGQPVQEVPRTGSLTVFAGQADIQRGNRVLQVAPGKDAAIVSGDRLASGRKALLRVTLADGSAIHMSSDTRLSYTEDTAKRGKMLRLEHGEIYLDIVAQQNPLRLAAGSAEVVLLGTAVHITHKKQKEDFTRAMLDTVSLAVYEGLVHVDCGNKSTYLSPGMRALFSPTDAKSHIRLLFGISPKQRQRLAWLSKTGAVLPAPTQASRPSTPAENLFKGSNLMIVDGTWRVTQEQAMIRVNQENSAGRGLVIFQDLLPRRGKLACRFRLIKASAARPGFMFAPFYMQRSGGFQVSSAGFEDLLSRFAVGEWLRFSVEYRIAKGNAFIYEKMTIKSEAKPEQALDGVLKGDPVMRATDPANEQRLLGFETRDCSAEITDITILDRDKVTKKPSK